MKQISIALAGNPNVGKSTVFNALTGMHQHTGNWSGKTVETARGYFSTERYSYTVTDLPGTYSLSTRSAEEAAALSFLQSGEADIVVAVCDATCIERSLLLVLQLSTLCERLLVCVNLLDEAESKGISLDLPLISSRLGLPVVGVTATKKKSLNALKKMIDEAVAGNLPFDSKLGKNLTLVDDDTSSFASANAIAAESKRICNGAVFYEKAGVGDKDRRIDRIATSRLWGYPIMIALLVLVLWLTVSGANYPSAWLYKLFEYGERGLILLWQRLSLPKLLYGPLVDGMYCTLATVVSVMLPPMAIFFPLFTFLEDMGYLPRIAFNLDKPFARCKACGKQALTMCMGFGCNAVGVTGCRIINSSRERLLAMLTNSLVPCNGKFPALITVISLFAAGGGALSGVKTALVLSLAIVISVAVTLGATSLLSATALRGKPSSFVLELPSYRKPQLGKIIVRSVLDRTLFVLGRAVVISAPAGLLIWISANVCIGGESIMAHLCGFFDPVGKLMGLDGTVITAFILGFPANETVLPIMLAAYLGNGTVSEISDASLIRSTLVSNGWDVTTAICFVLFSLMHWPCSTTLLTIKKESGSIKWALLAALLPSSFGFGSCVLVNLLSKIFS